MKRREFIAVLGGAAASWPVAARGQQSMPVIGVLDSYGDTAVLPAFRDGLSEAGYTVGGNVVLDVRSTEQYDRLPVLAADLVSGHPKVLVAVDGPSHIWCAG
jgi:putative tryptophan/tyrosine transport system substrate-binding protein